MQCFATRHQPLSLVPERAAAKLATPRRQTVYSVRGPVGVVTFRTRKETFLRSNSAYFAEIGHAPG